LGYWDFYKKMQTTPTIRVEGYSKSEDYIILKLKLASALFKVPIKLEYTASNAQLAFSLQLLKVQDFVEDAPPSSVVSQQNSILRYIASLSTTKIDSLQQAEIDELLESSWQELGRNSIFEKYIIRP